MLTGPHTDHPATRSVGRLFSARLLANGIVIYEYQPAFAHQVESAFERSFHDSVVVRHGAKVEHPWNVQFWRLVARATFAWASRAVARLRR